MLREKRAAAQSSLDQLLAVPTAQRRDLLVSESRTFDRAVAEITSFDARISELEA